LAAFALGSLVVLRRGQVVLPPAPPESAAEPELTGAEGNDGRPVVRWGRSELERRAGLWVLRLTGDDAQRGAAYGALATPLLEPALGRWRSVVHTVNVGPTDGAFARWLHPRQRSWFLHELTRQLPSGLATELGAAVRQSRVEEVERSDTFATFAAASSLDQLAHRFERAPPLGGVAVAVSSLSTADRHVLVGRSVELELPPSGAGAPAPSLSRLVVAHAGTGQLPFVGVTWPGVLGVVAGLNGAHLFVSVQGAITDDAYAPAPPNALGSTWLAQQVLERCHSLGEAIDLVAKAPLAGAHAILLADGNAHEVVVVERSPGRTATRRSTEAIFTTGHLGHLRFRGDARNDEAARLLASGPRAHRVAQLLELEVRASRRAPVTIDRLVALLRDRHGPTGDPRPLGHPAAIETLRAAHGLVADVTAGILWVAEGPGLLGRFHRFDVAGTSADGGELAADPQVDIDALARLDAARGALELALRWAGEDPADLDEAALRRALREARRAVLLAPGLPEPHHLEGRLREAAGQQAAALAAYRRYLDAGPIGGTPAERARVQRYIDSAARR
jgi:hypothetical protein